MKPSSNSLRITGVIAIIVVISVIGLSASLAQQVPFADGRINQISFFGGDAFYCVDKEYRVTMELPNEANGGGFRLLDMNGQVLWYIPGADVTSALNLLGDGSGGPVLVASGQGSYGATNLYVNKDADGQNIYVYTGYDNYSKANSFIFGSCIPQGADPSFSLTPSALPTSGSSATASMTSSPGPSATASDTLTPTQTQTPTDTLTPTQTQTPTDTLTPTNTFTSTDTLTPTNTFTPTDTLTPTNTFTPTDTLTPTNTSTWTDTPEPTATDTEIPG